MIPVSKIKQIKAEVESANATLLVVSKNRPNDQILELYDMGFRQMGENRVQSLLDKKDELPNDIKWHIIGHLQKNKVKYIAPFVELIHSVDTIDLAKTIQKEAVKNNRIIPILLQFKVAKEESKFGIDPDNLNAFMRELENENLSNVRVDGIMGMASFTDNEDQVRAEFTFLKSIFDQLKLQYFDNSTSFREISMGMSSDYKMALEEGSTMVRLGSVLFE